MIRVKVPATSANMGPGFDSIGIALNLYNEYDFEGINDEFANEDNIILQAMKKTFDKYDYEYSGLLIKVIRQDIPISRGLGSSSSCIVAGIAGAMRIMNIELDREKILEIAVEIEGHPDNVCPAIFGGMTVAIMEGKKIVSNNIEVKPGIMFTAIVPRFRLSTAKSRAVLPKEIEMKDAIFNIGRTALLISAFSSGKYELLKYAVDDKLHQNYRSPLIPKFNELYKEAMDNGALACYLSGAGPTLMAIIDERDNSVNNYISNYIEKYNLDYDILELDIDRKGISII